MPPSLAGYLSPGSTICRPPAPRLSAISGSAVGFVGRRRDALQTGATSFCRDCRRTPRHTTHHKGLPEFVTITRPHHPLEGKKLAVFGQRRYQDKLHLILIMPKGGRSLMPTEWTDLKTPLQDSPAQARLNGHLGSIHDLLHARGVVDALLNRRTAQTGSDEKSVDEENAHRA